MNRSRFFVALIVMMTATFLMLGPSAALASVSTDQADYKPGSVVTISGDTSNGAGYLEGETVLVDVAGPNGYTASCEGTADRNGAWSCQVTLWDSLDAVGTYAYTATGLSSNVIEEGSFADNANMSLTAPAATSWYRTVTDKIDVSAGGKVTCTSGGTSCYNASILVEIFASDGVADVSGSAIATNTFTVSNGSNNADWAKAFAFRTSPGSGEFPIPADGKYDVRATFNGCSTNTSPCTGTARTESHYIDDSFGVDNTKPTSTIGTVTAGSLPSATGTATDPGSVGPPATFSGFENSDSPKPMHVEIRTNPGGATVSGSAQDLTLSNLGSTKQSGDWSYTYAGTALTPGGYCIVSRATDHAGNQQDPVTSSCFTVGSTNHAPAATTPTFSPAAPKTNDSLQASTTLSDADSGDTITGAFKWTVTSGGFTCQVGTVHTSAGVSASGDATARTVTDSLDLSASHSTSNCSSAGAPATINPSKGDTVTVEVTPNDTHVNGTAVSASVIIANTPPVANAGADKSGNEGSAIELDGSGSSDADGSVTYSWSIDTTGIDPSGSCSFDSTTAAKPKVTCTDDSEDATGDYFVATLTVTDGDGVTATDTVNVTVSNVAPQTGTVTNNGPINEGSSATISFSPTDAGSNDVLTKSYDCDNDGTYENSTGSCFFANNVGSPFTVRVRVTDDDGGSATGLTQVTVNNVAPVIAWTAHPSTANEGQTKTYTFSITDPGTDTWTFVSTYPMCGSLGTLVSGSASIDQTNKTGTFQCTFLDGYTGASSTVKAKIYDGDDNSNELPQSVSIANLPPVVAAPSLSTTTVDCRTAVTLTGISWTDPGGDFDKPFSVTINWGDSSSDTYSNINAFSLADKTHAYSTPGTHAPTVIVTDKDGALDNGSGSNTSSNSVVVNQAYTVGFLQPFDPSTSSPSKLITNTMKAGRVVPVKATIYDVCTQSYVSDPTTVVSIVVKNTSTLSGASNDAVETYADAGASNGNTLNFRWTSDSTQPGGGFWIYNLDSKTVLNGSALVVGQEYRTDIYVGSNKATKYQWALLKPTK